MHFFQQLWDLLRHLDSDHVSSFCKIFGGWTYAVLFAIIFAETGLVITPFLPGDSLLFVFGAVAATGALNPWWLFILLTIAAIVGDGVNYAIGWALGPKVMTGKPKKLLKLE